MKKLPTIDHTIIIDARLSHHFGPVRDRDDVSENIKRNRPCTKGTRCAACIIVWSIGIYLFFSSMKGNRYEKVKRKNCAFIRYNIPAIFIG